MLDIRRLRSEPDIVKSAVARRKTAGLVEALDEILALDERRRVALSEVNDLKAQRNEVSKEIGRIKRDGERLQIPRRLPVGDSCGFVMVNIGLRGSPEELGLTCANLWVHPTRPDGDMFGAVNDFMRDPGDPANEPMMMVTFPSIKARNEGSDTTSCQLLCLADHAWFEKHASRRTRRRGPEYKALKAEWGERLIEVLLRHYPQLEGRIGLVDVSTPLSIAHYLGTSGGGAVGLDHTPARFTDWEIVRRLDARTEIPGLWLTGQDTVTCGQPIVQGAGLITALRILGPVRGLRYLVRAAVPVVRHVWRERRAER